MGFTAHTSSNSQIKLRQAQEHDFLASLISRKRDFSWNILGFLSHSFFLPMEMKWIPQGTPGELLAVPAQPFPLLTLGAVCPHETYIPLLCAVHFIQGELDFPVLPRSRRWLCLILGCKLGSPFSSETQSHFFSHHQSFLLSHIKGIFGFHLPALFSLSWFRAWECSIVREAGSLRSERQHGGFGWHPFLSCRELASLWTLPHTQRKGS